MAQSATHLQLVLKEFLDGNPVDMLKFKEAMTIQNWQDSKRFMCVYTVPNQAVGAEQPLYFSRLLSMEFPEMCLLVYKGKVICAVNLDYSKDSSDIFMTRFKYFLRDNALMAGFSNVFTDLTDLKSFYIQANVALELGLEKKPMEWFHSFSSYAMDYVAAKATADMERHKLCAYEILTLIEYDRVNNTDYRKTLETFLACYQNTSRAARALFIHRETMIYRLERIKALTGINYKDKNQILYLNFSFKIMESFM